MQKTILERAREVFDIEINGVQALRDGLGEHFETLVKNCASTIEKGGKLVITGIGKSGYIGKKMAATLSSVGSPAVFMHPVEARHGDLGIIQKNDLLIALSYSGETEELLVVLTPAKRLGVELVAITGNPDSTLAKMSDLVVEMPVPREACPFNLEMRWLWFCWICTVSQNPITADFTPAAPSAEWSQPELKILCGNLKTPHLSRLKVPSVKRFTP